ncbi:aminoglycoside phosphotransferase family protein [Streptomyces sp. SCA3-4]|uniref:phosphotransferase family protein n=1 Tax=Streptomyces sichuanensis TaxID=2871810 RepID=UPI001CE23615|nr:aminoglycoside phosphotransferase family protein [Streptomyces sichuanensis]MCA6095936.1 aminoglycoside phosphotransferase family protein [Streptomyces sichuanensis]
MQRHEEKWLDHFAGEGYEAVEPLGSGMEGAVYRLDDGMVAKVWGERSAQELRRLGRFYAHLDQAGLPFATPLYHEVLEVFGKAVTVERHLPGVPLDDKRFSGPQEWPTVLSCLGTVLGAFAEVPDAPELRDLPVMAEKRALWDGSASWSQALSTLVDDRADRFGDQLRAKAADFDTKLAQLHRALATLDDVRPALVHGDLIPGNILVGADGAPAAVLDFGFFSTAGDPAFDAALTASIFDMYGTDAQDTEARIDRELNTRFGHPPDRLALYRSAYAVITSNAYDPLGQDGHFQWCADTLNRPSVSEALRRAPTGR